MAFRYVAGTDDSYTWVREMIGDVDSTAVLLVDEIIDAVLVKQPIPTYAAAVCCALIMGRLARKVSKSIGATRLELQQQFEHYKQLRADLMGGAGTLPGNDGAGTPPVEMFAGGTSYDEADALAEDEDRIQPAVSVGQHDFPGTGVPPKDPGWRP